MQIALIELGASRPELHEPLGIEVLAGVIAGQFKPEDVHLDVFSLSFEEMSIEKIDFRRYQIVGLSAKLGSLLRLREIVRVIRGVRRIDSEFPLVAIGDLLGTFAWQDLAAEMPEAIFVLGEGEDALAGIVRVLTDIAHGTQSIRNGLRTYEVPNLVFLDDAKRIVQTPKRIADLGALPPPKRIFLPSVLKTRSQAQIEGSRGCPWGHCSFCSIPSFQGRRWRPYPLEKIIDQLESLSDAGIRNPYFTDADFVGDGLARGMDFARLVMEAKKRGQLQPDLGFYINLPVSAIVGGKYASSDACITMLTSLKAVGLREVFVGIESGAVGQVRRYMKAATVQRNLRALSTLDALGISTDIGFIMFEPRMTFDDLFANIDFIHRAKLDAHPSRLTKALRLQPETTYAKTTLSASKRAVNLNLNNLTYPYEFQDPHIARVYQLFRTWELGHLDLATLIQGACKGEVDSEQDRGTARSYLGRIRELDIRYLEACAKSVRYQQNNSQELCAFAAKLKTELDHILGTLPKLVHDHAQRLGLDLDTSLCTQKRYVEKYRTLSTYEDPVDNIFLTSDNC